MSEEPCLDCHEPIVGTKHSVYSTDDEQEVIGQICERCFSERLRLCGEVHIQRFLSVAGDIYDGPGFLEFVKKER